MKFDCTYRTLQTVIRKKKFHIVIAALIFVKIIVYVYSEILITAWNKHDVRPWFMNLWNIQNTASSYAGKKTILLWTPFFEDHWFHMGETDHFAHCPIHRNCFMTRSRDLFDVRKFDAIFFHGNEINARDLPGGRSPQQKYVFVNLESPKNWPLAESFIEDYFNLTMTYRLDSDIPWPYYLVRDGDTGEMVAPLQSVEWIERSYDPWSLNLDWKFYGKTKMAAWLVSNCKTLGKRESYVEMLEAYVQVDRIGGCAQQDIPDCMESTDNCFTEVIEPEYFFYLSFENTLCQDYVTEKFFNALSYDVIPVVYGGADYSLFAPPHSYINALDFATPKTLADFLIALSQDREEYLKYFWWKRFYTLDSPREWTLCKICEVLNESKPPKTYSPLSSWYEKDKCPIHDRPRKHRGLEFANKHDFWEFFFTKT